MPSLNLTIYDLILINICTQYGFSPYGTSVGWNKTPLGASHCADNSKYQAFLKRFNHITATNIGILINTQIQ